MKKIICIFITVLVTVCFFSFPSFADSAVISLSKSNVTVGTNVTVTLKYNAGFEMYAIDGTLTYNNSVLKYVSGGSSNSGSAVKIVEGLSGEKSVTYSIVFKTIAAGSGSLSFSAATSGGDAANGNASAGAAVTVTEAKPSSNNNLGSLKISEGTLTPAFKAGTTSYTASVKYPTDKITISANAAVGDSKVAGVGTFNLKVGDNRCDITVTAASGDKKTYTVFVKRMTEEETAAVEKEERKKNPFLFVDNGEDRLLVPDLSSMTVFEGFSLSSFENKGEKINCLADKHGKYNLVWATDANGSNGTFYDRNKDGKYTKIDYIQTGEKIYIVQPFEDDINVNSLFVPAKYEKDGVKLDCYQYSDIDLADFYVFYCYIDGENGYYMLDIAQNTIQREPTFLSTDSQTKEVAATGVLEKFNSLNTQAKIVLLLLMIAALLVVALIILLIVKAVSSPNGDKQDAATDNTDFDLVEYSGEEDITGSVESQAVADEVYYAPVEEKTSVKGSPVEADQTDNDMQFDKNEFIELEEDF